MTLKNIVKILGQFNVALVLINYVATCGHEFKHNVIFVIQINSIVIVR